MANLTLVYGMRLLPSDEVSEVGDATLKLKNGREAHVTMHVLEGSKEEIEKQLRPAWKHSSISIPRSRTNDLGFHARNCMCRDVACYVLPAAPET